MHKLRPNFKSGIGVEWCLTVGLRDKNLENLSTSKPANLIIKGGMILLFIPLKYKALYINKIILLPVLLKKNHISIDDWGRVASSRFIYKTCDNVSHSSV